MLAALCALLVLALLVGSSGSGDARNSEDERHSGIGTVSVSELQPAVRETLRLIKLGGPFPHAKDGGVFGNRERLLPWKPRGYYREFTVHTAGSRDRGPRRIITGDDGEFYYTDDHYRSFRRILE